MSEKKTETTKIDRLWEAHDEAGVELQLAAIAYVRAHFDLLHKEAEESETADRLLHHCHLAVDTFAVADDAEIREAGRRQAAELGERGTA